METAWDFIVEETELQYYCILCGCDVFGDENVENHVNGARHTESLNLYGTDIHDDGDNRYYCRLCDCFIFKYSQVRDHVTGRKHRELLNKLESSRVTVSDIFSIISVIATVISFLFLASLKLLKITAATMSVFFGTAMCFMKAISRINRWSHGVSRKCARRLRDTPTRVVGGYVILTHTAKARVPGSDGEAARSAATAAAVARQTRYRGDSPPACTSAQCRVLCLSPHACRANFASTPVSRVADSRNWEKHTGPVARTARTHAHPPGRDIKRHLDAAVFLRDSTETIRLQKNCCEH